MAFVITGISNGCHQHHHPNNLDAPVHQSQRTCPSISTHLSISLNAPVHQSQHTCPSISTHLSISLNAPVHQSQRTCPSTSTHLSINLNAPVHQSQHTCPSISMHLSINLNAPVHQSQRTCPSVSTHLSISLNAPVHQSQHTYPSISTHLSISPSMSLFNYLSRLLCGGPESSPKHRCRQATCGYIVYCFVCVFMVMDFSTEDKASSVKFCTAVHRRLRQRATHFVNFAPSKAQNRPANRSARALNYKKNWKEPSLACRLRLTEVRATFYL